MALTLEQQLEMDYHMYGMSIEKLNEDGTIERIDPTMVRITRRKDTDSKFPMPPDGKPDKIIEIII